MLCKCYTLLIVLIKFTSKVTEVYTDNTHETLQYSIVKGDMITISGFQVHML